MATVVLICAVLAATAAGVLIAYWVCYAMFALFRIHAHQVAVRATEAVVREQQVLEI